MTASKCCDGSKSVGWEVMRTSYVVCGDWGWLLDGQVKFGSLAAMMRCHGLTDAE